MGQPRNKMPIYPTMRQKEIDHVIAHPEEELKNWMGSREYRRRRAQLQQKKASTGNTRQRKNKRKK